MATLHRYSKKIRKPISSNGKCGDITYCVQVGKRVYALNCIYCPQICLQWDMFINHMENDHYDDLNTDSGQPMESEEMDLQIEPARKEPSVTLQRNQTTPLVSSNKSEASDHCSFNDPLEDDNSNNLMSLESSIKIENPDYPSDQPAIDDTNSFHCDKIGIDKSDFEFAAGLEQNLMTENSNSSMANTREGRFATFGDLNNIKTELKEDLQDTELNLSNVQNVYVPHTDNLQNLLFQLIEEVKSLKSGISGMKKDIKELKDENKRSLLKLTKEVNTVKLENRKHHDDSVICDDQCDLRKFPMVAVADIEKFDKEVLEDENKYRQFKQFIAKTGGDVPAQFIRAAVRKVFSDELATLYSWKGTSTKPSAEKIYLITIIKDICHHKFQCTEKDMNAVLQRHFVHAKERLTKRKHPN